MNWLRLPAAGTPLPPAATVRCFTTCGSCRHGGPRQVSIIWSEGGCPDEPWCASPAGSRLPDAVRATSARPLASSPGAAASPRRASLRAPSYRSATCRQSRGDACQRSHPHRCLLLSWATDGSASSNSHGLHVHCRRMSPLWRATCLACDNAPSEIRAVMHCGAPVHGHCLPGPRFPTRRC